MNIRNYDVEAKKTFAAQCMEKIEEHFSLEEHAPMYMPRTQYEALKPYFTGFFLVDYESPFDATDLPPMVTITDWMANGS